MPLLLPLSPHESFLAKLVKNRGVFTNPIHLNDAVVLMLLVIPEDWRNTSLPATTRKKGWAWYKNIIPLRKHAQKGKGGMHHHTSPPLINKNKTWTITCRPSYDCSSRTNPKVSLFCSHTIRVPHLLPLCSRAAGEQRAGREQCLGKDSSSATPPFSWWRSHCPPKAAKATAEQLWWLSHRSCLPALPTKAASRAANTAALLATRWLQVSAHSLSALISLKWSFSSSDTPGVVSKISLKFNRIWRPELSASQVKSPAQLVNVFIFIYHIASLTVPHASRVIQQPFIPSSIHYPSHSFSG